MEELRKTSPEYASVLAEINITLGVIGLPPGEYPGGQPIHINETQMMDVLKKTQDGDYKYSMNLKSDGVRYLMFGGPLVNSQGRSASSMYTAEFKFRRPYFVNRRFGIFKMSEQKHKGIVLIRSRHPFILDGEVIEYDSKKRPHFHLTPKENAHTVFNVFDALLTSTTTLKSVSKVRWESVEEFLAPQNGERDSHYALTKARWERKMGAREKNLVELQKMEAKMKDKHAENTKKLKTLEPKVRSSLKDLEGSQWTSKYYPDFQSFKKAVGAEGGWNAKSFQLSEDLKDLEIAVQEYQIIAGKKQEGQSNTLDGLVERRKKKLEMELKLGWSVKRNLDEANKTARTQQLRLKERRKILKTYEENLAALEKRFKAMAADRPTSEKYPKDPCYDEANLITKTKTRPDGKTYEVYEVSEYCKVEQAIKEKKAELAELRRSDYEMPKHFEMTLSRYFSLENLIEAPTGKDTFTWLTKQFGKSTPRGYPIPYDGVIFSPVNLPYVRGPWVSCTNVAFKWKPRNLSTIDLALKRDGKKVEFHTKSGYNLNISLDRVDNLPNATDAPDGTVIELKYWNKTKRYQFTRIRKDKTKNMANGKKTVENVTTANFDLDFLRDFVKNPLDRGNIDRVLNYLGEAELKRLVMKMSPSRPATRKTLGKMLLKEDSFLRIEYPTDKWHDTCKCLGTLYPAQEVILFHAGGVDYASVGLSGNTWIKRRQGWARKKVGKPLKIKDVEISQVTCSQSKAKGPSPKDISVLADHTQQIFRYTFDTHFGEITFEKRFISSASGKLSKPKLSMYTEIKSAKVNGPDFVLNLIKEFSFYLSNRARDKK